MIQDKELVSNKKFRIGTLAKFLSSKSLMSQEKATFLSDNHLIGPRP
jgi:hypothetical protein